MQGYYEIETEIPANRELHIHLPREIPPGQVKIAIIYDLPESPNPKTLTREVMGSLRSGNFTPIDQETILAALTQNESEEESKEARLSRLDAQFEMLISQQGRNAIKKQARRTLKQMADEMGVDTTDLEKYVKRHLQKLRNLTWQEF